MANGNKPMNSFMAHPETLLPMSEIDDPVQRFVSVVKFYLSGWHIRPSYVPKMISRYLSPTKKKRYCVANVILFGRILLEVLKSH